jgi:hypothetical protein
MAFRHLLALVVIVVFAPTALASKPDKSPSGVAQSIANGATLSGSVAWTAAPSGNPRSVAFQVDATVVATRTSSPYAVSLDTTRLGNGSHTFKVTATFTGSRNASASASATVANQQAAPPPPPPPPPPPAAITQSIGNGSTIAGAVQWTASPPAGTVTKVEFAVDGTVRFTDSSAPFVFNGDGNALDTTTLIDGSHTFKVMATYGDGTTAAGSVTATVANASVSPPPRGGYFTLRPVGAWSSLPDDAACTEAVHRSAWEPRPDNYKRNHVMPDATAVHAAFTARPLAVDDNYDARWDSWLLQRVDGQFTGTTDEIFQWAACKWGLSDDMLRAIAVRESTWYQYETYPSGRCVLHYSCGDMFSTPTADSTVYCNGIAKYGYDYQKDFGKGLCPQTFSIIGLKSWEAPSWGQMPDNQNGAFPFNRDSTAFAVDYLAGHLRGCYEGWEHWLTRTTGDIWGCVGSWYSGDWHSSDAAGYISLVQGELAAFTWLQPGWRTDHPACNKTYGCPGPDPYPLN